MSYVENMVDPADLVELKTRTVRLVAARIREVEEEVTNSLNLPTEIQKEIARGTISDIWTELIQRDYSYLMEP